MGESGDSAYKVEIKVEIETNPTYDLLRLEVAGLCRSCGRATYYRHRGFSVYICGDDCSDLVYGAMSSTGKHITRITLPLNLDKYIDPK